MPDSWQNYALPAHCALASRLLVAVTRPNYNQTPRPGALHVRAYVLVCHLLYYSHTPSSAELDRADVALMWRAQRSAAHADVAPELEKLRVKAVTKAREYLMTRIYSLRKPKTNIQILQQNMLLRFRYLITFLRAYGQEVFGEVRYSSTPKEARMHAGRCLSGDIALQSIQCIHG